MKKENRRNILLRYFFIALAILGLSAKIVYNLVDNTILSAQKWNDLAMKELSKIDTIEPNRGDILACDGSVLATNMILYTPALDLRHERFDADSYRVYVPLVADSLARHFKQRTAAQWREYLLKPLEWKKRPGFYPIVKDISLSEVELIKTFPFQRTKAKDPKRRRIMGFTVKKRNVRVRPYGNMAGRSIGTVGVSDSVSRVHGKYGLEKALDPLLYGKPGIAKRVALTKNIVKWADVKPIDGYTVLSTIDIKMQDIVENELNRMLDFCGGEWGSAVLLDVKTGDIKAIANLELSPRDGVSYIESLNRAVLGYELGSVMKTLSMLIALEDGIITNLDEVIPIGAKWSYFCKKPIVDSHYNAELTVKEILEHSSNIGTAKIITRRFGPNPPAFIQRLKEIGFFEPIKSGIAGEAVPVFIPLANNDNGRQILSRQSYGYCSEISPLSMASIYNAIANDGVYVRPRLVKGLKGNGIDTIYPVTNIRDRICSVNNARILRQLLSRVVWEKGGTARNFLRSDMVRIIGKTGTANINLKGIGYRNGVNRVSFCGIFPEENPRYTCMVVISHPKKNAVGAPSTSGVVVKKIAEALYARGMLDYDDSYNKGTAPGQSTPTLYASLDPERNNRIQQNLSLGPRKTVLATPTPTTSGVPRVLGLGVREAVKQIELAGYEVRIVGTGCVVGQIPAPGSPAQEGSTVYLTLKQD